MNEISEESRLIRNLKDAGFDEESIQIFLKLKSEDRVGEQYRLLSIHRALLLERIHINQQMIDCLDYLVYTMKNK